MEDLENDYYQLCEIVCECGHDYNEDKTLFDLLEKIDYNGEIKCPKCGKINHLEDDYIYVDELEDEIRILRIYNN